MSCHPFPPPTSPLLHLPSQSQLFYTPRVYNDHQTLDQHHTPNSPTPKSEHNTQDAFHQSSSHRCHRLCRWRIPHERRLGRRVCHWPSNLQHVSQHRRMVHWQRLLAEERCPQLWYVRPPKIHSSLIFPQCLSRVARTSTSRSNQSRCGILSASA